MRSRTFKQGAGSSAMTTLYKYGAMAAVGLALIIGAWFYGHHEGSLAGKAEVATLVAQYSAAEAKGYQAAAAAQSAADQAAISQAQAAVSAANAAVVARQASLQAAAQSIASLRGQLARNAKSPGAAQWLKTKIPPGALVGTCWSQICPW
ncbi:MAG: hypothetical protein ACRD2G_07475 [Terriglobia bacterium]